MAANSFSRHICRCLCARLFDGIKELIIEEDKYARDYYVFTVKKGKVQFAGSVCNAFGSGKVIYNKKKKGLIAQYTGGGCTGNGFFQLKNGKLKETHETYIFFNRKTTFQHNYRSCSKKTYNKCYNTYFNRDKYKSHFTYYKFIKITNKNVEKKLG